MTICVGCEAVSAVVCASLRFRLYGLHRNRINDVKKTEHPRQLVIHARHDAHESTTRTREADSRSRGERRDANRTERGGRMPPKPTISIGQRYIYIIYTVDDFI